MIKGVRCYPGPGGKPFVSVSAVLDEIYPIPPQVSALALESGRIYHLWVARYLESLRRYATTMKMEEADYMDRLDCEADERIRTAFRWIKDNVSMIFGVEELCFSPYGFAGRRDFRGVINENLTLLDWKFGQKTQARYDMQIEAYRHLEPVPVHAALILVPPSGPIKRYPHKSDPTRWARFLMTLGELTRRIKNGTGT